MSRLHPLNFDDVSVLVARELSEAFERNVVPSMAADFLKALACVCAEEPEAFKAVCDMVAAEREEVTAEEGK